jgi:hypothetical protein
MGMTTGGQGSGSHTGGSGTMMPSARAVAGSTRVNIRMVNKLAVSSADFGFIFSS